MKSFIALLCLLATPAHAAMPPIVRLDQPLMPLAILDAVQVAYGGAIQQVAIRMRVQNIDAQGQLQDPQVWCIVVRPTSYPPAGVEAQTWVPLSAGIADNASYSNLTPFWRGVCLN